MVRSIDVWSGRIENRHYAWHITIHSCAIIFNENASIFLCFLSCTDEQANFFVSSVSPVVPLRDLEPRGVDFCCEAGRPAGHARHGRAAAAAAAANGLLISDMTITNGHYRPLVRSLARSFAFCALCPQKCLISVIINERGVAPDRDWEFVLGF